MKLTILQPYRGWASGEAYWVPAGDTSAEAAVRGTVRVRDDLGAYLLATFPASFAAYETPARRPRRRKE